MKYLLIDTSTNALIIMLYVDNKKLDEQIRLGKQDHQAHIIPMIDAVLSKQNMRPKDLDGIIVGVGPGSYTGLRVGVMTAKMLSYTTGVKLYQISSLVFLTSGYTHKLLAWHDARNNQGFSATIFEGKIIDEEKVRHEDELTPDDKARLIRIENDTILIDAAVIIAHKTPVDDVYKLIPNYLRKTEAEKNLDKKS